MAGVDVDSDNLEWCRQNLPFASFRRVPLYPPTDLPSSSFDLIYGISVFTHLGRDAQDAWLAELYRIAAPGAILLMTTHGRGSFCRAALPYHLGAKWFAEGILDSLTNPGLAGIIADDTYYRNTFHTEAYIRRVWSKHFRIVAIIPTVIGNHQDLVVMRKTG